MEWKGKLAASLILLALGVWIGMNAAAGGMEEIHGPFSAPAPDDGQSLQAASRDMQEPVEAGYPLLEGSAGTAAQHGQGYDEALDVQPPPRPADTTDSLASSRSWRPEPKQSFMEKAADQTGALVQHTAQKSLEALIAWFESATD